MRRKRLRDVLRERKHLSEAALARALEEQKTKLAMLGEILLESGRVSKPDLVAALEEVTHVRYIDLEQTPVDPELLTKVPRSMALQHCVLPVARHGKKIKVAMLYPRDLHLVDELRFKLGAEIDPGFRQEIESAIAEHYPEAKKSAATEVVEFAGQIDSTEIEFFAVAASERHEEAIQEFQRELRSNLTPAVHLVSAILSAAAAKGASDIHIEQQATGMLVRIRVDGLLRNLTQVPRELRSSLISRIKILCDMDIAERRVPQDGRLLAKIGPTKYDLRVSTLPTQYGEKVNIRLLDPTAAAVSFSNLGLAGEHARTLEEVLSLPQGMVLVTGPTGSGKTTTLYAAMNLLRSPEISILTVEDPVEYMMEGINQVPVNSRVGRTFANCLRSILRQDPNVIMVGEIRDPETAEIALQTSQTGHLVLSSLHTNDSIGAITRLLDLDIPAFLITASVTAIMAQRLVRKLCDCRQEEAVSERVSRLMSQLGVSEIPETTCRPVGCKLCDQTGFRGRIGVFELMVLDDQIRDAINANAHEDHIRSLAWMAGFRPMLADALEKVREGITTLEEVLRGVPPENLEGRGRCAECGKHLAATFLYCPYCGAATLAERLRPHVASEPVATRRARLVENGTVLVR